MTKKILTLIFLALFGAVMISSCSTSNSLASATSWPGITADADNEIVYLAAGTQVYAISTKSGSEVWRYPEKPARGVSFFTAPSLADGLVIAGDYKTSVHAINASDGSEAWIFSEARDKFVGSAVVANETIFAPSADHHIYALNLNGDLNFKVKTDQPNWAATVSDGDTVYAPSLDHHVYAFDANTGDILWKTDVDGAVAASLVLEDGVLYIATLNKEALAIDTADGEIRWRVSVDDFTWAAPTLIEDLVIVVNASGGIFALNAADGSVAWTADSSGEVTASAVAVPGGFIIVNHEAAVISFALDGTKQWTRSVDVEVGSTPSTPVIVGELILIPVAQSTEALLVAFDLNGNEIWDFVPEK